MAARVWIEDATMRILYFLFFIICAVIVLSMIATGGNATQSTNSVMSLLAALKRSDVPTATPLLGDNTCHCPPRGGWVSLLKYESGHEPNLAFLVGKHFSVTDVQTRSVPVTLPYVFPWEKPEDRKVDLTIRFNADQQPYFLPLNLAYGIPMSAAEFEKWRQSFRSDTHPRGLTLRLRNNLSAGTIVQVAPDKREAGLPADIRAYLHPKDCAKVIDTHNSPLPIDSVARMLPRLSSVHIAFLVVRRGVMGTWTIKSFQVTEPVFSS